MEELFKDKDGEERVGVTNFINKIVQILKQDLRQVKISTQEAGLIKPVKLQNKGQLSHIGNI